MECWNTEKKKQYGFMFQGEMLLQLQLFVFV